MSQENKPSKFTLELPLSKAVENAQARNLIRGMSIGSNSVNQKIFKKLQQQFSPKIFKQCVFHAGRAGYLSWLDADEIRNESWGSLFVSPITDAPKQEMLIAYLAARFETHSKTLNEFIRELRILDNSIAHQDDKALEILISMVVKNDTTLDNYFSNYFPSGMHISKIAYENSLTCLTSAPMAQI